MKRFAMFPGQGSQTPGMATKILADFPKTKEIFEEAEDFSRLSLRRLCTSAGDDELLATSVQQPAILSVSTAIYSVLSREVDDLSFRLFAGHSLGEYSALVASGALLFSDAVQLVCARAKAMEACIDSAGSMMLAVIGLDSETLAAACSQFAEQSGVCEIANYNSSKQQILSGSKEKVLAVGEHLKAQHKRLILKPLAVSAPFHCSLMKPAAEKLAPHLQGSIFAEQHADVIANVTGLVAKPYQASLLVEQVFSPVRWSQTLATAAEEGVEQYIEIGPGRVLAGLARREVGKESSILHSGDLPALIAALNRA